MTSTSAGVVGPGTVLAGRYRLEDLLVESSGAWFWRATDTVLSRNVAVHAVRSADERAAPMLEAARVSATVNDSHLLRVLDCAEEGAVCWVVHEWGEGLSLDLLLERGPLAPERAAWLAREVADAIAAGHAQGVAHGRLNPEAVLVTHSGGVKLIGYVVDASLHQSTPVSPVYGELDPREADVVDAAGILYAALTGRWPGLSDSSVPPAPLDGSRPLRPRQVRAGVPRALDAICERVLHREGARHEMAISDARELAAALADATGSGGHGGAPVSLAGRILDDAAGPGDADLSDSEATTVIPRSVATSVDTDELEATQASAPDVSAAPEPAPEPAPGPAPGSAPETAPASPEQPRLEPYVESPDRPLFSEARRRVPAGAGVGAAAPTPGPAPTSSAHHVVPPPPPGPESWHLDRAGDPTPPTVDRHEGRGWLRTAVVIGAALLTMVAVVATFTLGQRGSLPGLGAEEENAPAAGSDVIEVQSVTDFDPEGDGEENADRVGNVVDGDPETSWTTVTYYNRPDLGGLKPGVGLLLDLGADRQVRELDVQFAEPGTSLEVYASSNGVTDPPTDVGGLGPPVGAADQTGERARVPLEPAPTTRYLVLWLTELPAAPGGFQGEVVEVVPRS